MDEYIDWPALQAQCQGRQAFINRLLTLMVQSHAQTPAKLRALAGLGDLAALALVAHGFAGVAGSLHADQLRATGKAVELQARAGDVRACPEAEALAATIERFIEAISIYLSGQGND